MLIDEFYFQHADIPAYQGNTGGDLLQYTNQLKNQLRQCHVKQDNARQAQQKAAKLLSDQIPQSGDH